MPASQRRDSHTPTVLLVDEDAMFRHGVRELLEAHDLQVLGEAHSAAEAVELAIERSPDVILVAVWMRGTSGIEAAARICDAVPKARVVMLTNSTSTADAEEAIRAGACGYVLKEDQPEGIANAVRAAAVGGSPLSPRIAAGLLGHLGASRNGDGPKLTTRETKVLRLLAAGHKNSEIAADLSISVYTVKRHVSNLLGKLDAENRTQAAVEAARRGLV